MFDGPDAREGFASSRAGRSGQHLRGRTRWIQHTVVEFVDHGETTTQSGSHGMGSVRNLDHEFLNGVMPARPAASKNPVVFLIVGEVIPETGMQQDQPRTGISGAAQRSLKTKAPKWPLVRAVNHRVRLANQSRRLGHILSVPRRKPSTLQRGAIDFVVPLLEVVRRPSANQQDFFLVRNPGPRGTGRSRRTRRSRRGIRR